MMTWISCAILCLSVVAVVVESARFLWSLERDRSFWAGVAGLAVALLLLHLGCAPFLDDIRPSLFMVNLGEAHRRYSGVWTGVLTATPLALTPSGLSTLNVILAELLLLPLLSLAFRLFTDRFAALLCACYLVCSAVFVKFTSSTGPQILLILCCVAAAERLLAWLGSRRRLDLLLSASCAACMIDLRPEGFAGAIAVALLLPGRLDRRPGWRDLGAVAIPMLLVGLPPLWRSITALAGGSTGWLRLTPVSYAVFPFLASSPFIPTQAEVVGGLLLAGFIAAVHLGPGRRALLWLWSAAAITSLGIVHVDSVTNHRYVFLALGFQSMLAGAIVYHVCLSLSSRWRGLKHPQLIALGCSLVILAGWVVPRTGFLGMRWPHTVEYEFLVESLQKIPDGATVLADIDDVREAGLKFEGQELSGLARRRHVWLDFKDPASLPRSGEAYLYLGGSCWIRQRDGQGGLPPETFTDIYPPCRRVLQSLAGRAEINPVSEVGAPGTSFLDDTPVAPTIRLSLYHVRLR